MELGSSAPFWQQIGNGTFKTISSATSGLVGDPACAPGQPCLPAVRVVGRDNSGSGSLINNVAAGSSNGTWSNLGLSATSPIASAALVRPDSIQSADAALVYIQDSTHAKHFDSTTGVTIDIGHP